MVRAPPPGSCTARRRPCTTGSTPPGSLLCTAVGLPAPSQRVAAPAPRASGIPTQRAAGIPASALASTGRTCSGARLRWSEQGKKKDLTSGPLQNLQKIIIVRSIYFFYLDFIHVDYGVYLSEIVLVGFNLTISAHWNEFAQNRWIFAISRNTGGFAYFSHKCGSFLKLTPVIQMQCIADKLH
jgi:hypothetical protein